ncbi:hypothetical protein [Pseudomonas yamanorum]
MRKTIQQLLLQEIASWQHRGLIDRQTQDHLSAPYRRPGQLLSTVLQWLGVGAVLLMGMAVLDSVGLLIQLTRSLIISAVLFFSQAWSCGGAGCAWRVILLVISGLPELPF